MSPQSARGLAHSTSWRTDQRPRHARSVLECGSPLPLSPLLLTAPLSPLAPSPSIGLAQEPTRMSALPARQRPSRRRTPRPQPARSDPPCLPQHARDSSLLLRPKPQRVIHLSRSQRQRHRPWAPLACDGLVTPTHCAGLRPGLDSSPKPTTFVDQANVACCPASLIVKDVSKGCTARDCNPTRLAGGDLSPPNFTVPGSGRRLPRPHPRRGPGSPARVPPRAGDRSAASSRAPRR